MIRRYCTHTHTTHTHTDVYVQPCVLLLLQLRLASPRCVFVRISSSFLRIQPSHRRVIVVLHIPNTHKHRMLATSTHTKNTSNHSRSTMSHITKPKHVSYRSVMREHARIQAIAIRAYISTINNHHAHGVCERALKRALPSTDQ